MCSWKSFAFALGAMLLVAPMSIADVPEGSGDQGATFVAAAFDSLNMQADADFVCSDPDILKNCSARINQAILDLPSHGGKIILSNGTFYLANSIELRSNLTLQGQGGSTKLIVSDNSTDEQATIEQPVLSFCEHVAV